MKSLPRYDPCNVDPNNIKSKLNQFGNAFCNTQNGCPVDISFIDQNLDCQGPLREKRFGNPGQTGYDGKPCDMIHMRGRLAAQHYTNSFVRILSDLNSNWRSKDSSRPQPHLPNGSDHQQDYQYQHGSRGYRNRQRGGHRNREEQQYTSCKRWTQPDQNGDYDIRVSNRFNNLGNC